MTQSQEINPTPSLTRPIVLVGLMGAGKSKIGRQISIDFDIEFIDTDAEIENIAGMSIAAIFDLYGEEKFREIEAREISLLLKGKPAVISTGGGAYLLFSAIHLSPKPILKPWQSAFQIQIPARC